MKNEISWCRGFLVSAIAACGVFATEARVVDGNLSLKASDGEVQTFDEELLFQGWSRVIDVPDGVTAVFNANIGHASSGGCSVFLNGDGTKILRGGMKVTACTDADNDANTKASRLQYGTFQIESDIDLPRYILGAPTGTPATFVVTNGAKIRNWGPAKNSFIQSCTIELRGGRFVNDSNLIYAQDARSHAHIHIFRDGLFDTGTSSFRCGNNGFAEFTVEEGGTFFWRQGPFSENGRTTVTINGGRFVRGNNGQDGFGLGQNPANDSSYQNKGGNVLNLNGGELWVGSLQNNSNATRNKNTKTVVNLNGGTIMCGSATTFWGGVLADLEVNVLEGGARVDTRGLNVTWNVGGTGPGGFVKLGVGTLTASAKLGFEGPVTVRAGTFAATDPTYVTQKVVLAPGGIFEPRGAATIAGLSSRDGALRLRCTTDVPALTVTSAPVVDGTLFFELQNAAGESLVTPGTYPILSGPGVTETLASMCKARNSTANRAYSFSVADGVLSVTVAEGTNTGTGIVSGSWMATAGGAWQDAANWSAGVPGGVDAEVVFGAAGAGPVSLDADATVAKLTLDGTAPYVLSGEGKLHFASSSGYTGITVNQGVHEIAVPVSADAPLRVSGGGTAVFTGNLDGAPDIQVISGKVASDDLSTLPKFLLAGGTFTYTGTDAGTAEGSLRQNGNGTLIQNAGAGPMTLKLAPYLSSSSTLTIQGNGTEEIVLDGTGWITQPRDGRCLWLDGGIFRFAPGLRMVWEYSGDSMTRIGGTASNRPISLQIDDGARVRWKETYLGGEAERGGSDIAVVQDGGVIELSGDLCLNRMPSTNYLAWTKNGGLLEGASWINFGHASMDFVQTAGETSFAGLAFGLQNSTTANFTKNEKGGKSLVDVQGGAFRVTKDLNWLGDTGGRRVDRLRVSGGELTLPATTRAVAYDAERPASFSTLELAGGTLKFGGVGTSGSANDYLAGLNYLSLTGEAAVDVPADATVTQPLVAAADATGLTKKGAGTLTLATTADLPAKVSVEQGTLATAFRTDAKANVPDGLLAFWTFDGADPLKDVTGHGYDLEQAVAGTEVQFTEEEAHAGRSAWWQTPGAVLKCTKLVSGGFHRMTVSLWVRLESKNGYKSHIGMFSMRNNLAGTASSMAFDIAYKGTINNNSLRECGIGNCFFGSIYTGIPKSAGGDISIQEWHMVTITRDGGRVRGYVDGLPCTDVLAGSEASTLLENGRMITLGANISSASGFNEMLNKDARLDDVAIYSRCLEDADVAALYAAQVRPSRADEVRVASSATLDLRGSFLTTALLGGAGTVASGSVTTLSTLAVDPAEPLTVDALVLGESGTVDCGRTADDPLPTKGTLVVVRANAVSGADPATWTVTGTGWQKGRGRARLVLNDDNDLALELTGSGTVVVFR